MLDGDQDVSIDKNKTCAMVCLSQAAWAGANVSLHLRSCLYHCPYPRFGAGYHKRKRRSRKSYNKLGNGRPAAGFGGRQFDDFDVFYGLNGGHAKLSHLVIRLCPVALPLESVGRVMWP